MLAVLCWLSWPLTVVMQSAGSKLTYIMMVPVHNFCVAYGHCTVKQTYENVLNNVVKVTTGSWVSLAIPYVAIRLDFGLCDGGNINSYPGWIHIPVYHNCWYKCYVCCTWIGVLYNFQRWEQNPCRNMSVCCSTPINFDFCACCWEQIGLPVYVVWGLKIVAWWLLCFFCLYNCFVRETVEM